MDIEKQYDKIYRYCYFKLCDKQLAQDITQEAFLRFFRQGSSFDNGKELAYLYTIAKNLCID
ncbi:MAG: RNA polymerase sigma factor, partial [Oscillospiraceae bacterium]|nr:RNA polymerase sigma factor [Oscillospiraceae bacterium]